MQQNTTQHNTIISWFLAFDIELTFQFAQNSTKKNQSNDQTNRYNKSTKLNSHKIPDKNQMKTVIIQGLVCWFERWMHLHRKLEAKSQATALKTKIIQRYREKFVAEKLKFITCVRCKSSRCPRWSVNVVRFVVRFGCDIRCDWRSTDYVQGKMLIE